MHTLVPRIFMPSYSGYRPSYPGYSPPRTPDIYPGYSYLFPAPRIFTISYPGYSHSLYPDIHLGYLPLSYLLPRIFTRVFIPNMHPLIPRIGWSVRFRKSSVFNPGYRGTFWDHCTRTIPSYPGLSPCTPSYPLVRFGTIVPDLVPPNMFHILILILQYVCDAVANMCLWCTCHIVFLVVEYIIFVVAKDYYPITIYRLVDKFSSLLMSLIYYLLIASYVTQLIFIYYTHNKFASY